MRIEPDQIPRLPEAILAGQDDPPLEFALKLLRDNAPELHTALWRSNFKDQNACAWLAEHVPDHYRPPMNEADEPSEVDMYDVAPVRGTSGEGDESELAEALLFDRQDDQGYVIQKRARPKGHRVTRLAVRIQGGQRNANTPRSTTTRRRLPST